MVKPLTFKGDKKIRKRKRLDNADKVGDEEKSISTFKAANIENDAAADDDSWINADTDSDIVGPTLIVLPSDPPSCLACDPNGKVFASVLENFVDNNPATAEPHDVRQVWVANRVVGSESFSFKSHHGKYLSCDKYGILSSNSEAVSPLESFLVIPTADTPGTFQLQTLRETFLTINPSTKPNSPPEIRGDAENVSFNTTFRIRIQARFKPKYKASKQEKARERISRKEIEEAAGRRLNDEEVKRLKKARKEGDYHEALLLIKVKGKHDKYS